MYSSCTEKVDLSVSSNGLSLSNSLTGSLNGSFGVNNNV